MREFMRRDVKVRQVFTGHRPRFGINELSYNGCATRQYSPLLCRRSIMKKPAPPTSKFDKDAAHKLLDEPVQSEGRFCMRKWKDGSGVLSSLSKHPGYRRFVGEDVAQQVVKMWTYWIKCVTR
jgi:hypothetical protein